jgi:transcriptional regulator with XRE-family HTH domain
MLLFNVKRLRYEKGWTQKELSERSDVGRITISRLESGALKDTSAVTFAKLAITLGCKVDDLIFAYVPYF